MEELFRNLFNGIIGSIDSSGFLVTIVSVLLVLFVIYPFITKDSFIHRMIVGAIIFMIVTLFSVGVYFWVLKENRTFITEQNSNSKKISKQKKLSEEINISSRVQIIKDKEKSLKKIIIPSKTKVIEDEENFYEEEKIDEEMPLSLKETVLKFINNMNQRTEEGYNNSYYFIQKYLKNKFISKEDYLKYWDERPAQFIINDINESNSSFSVIIDFDKSSIDIFNTYIVEEDNYQWYIKDKTQKILHHFDNWKIVGDEHLIYSNKRIKGVLYPRKPIINWADSKQLAPTDSVAYVEIEANKFYLSQYSLLKLITDEPQKCNWMYEQK